MPVRVRAFMRARSRSGIGCQGLERSWCWIPWGRKSGSRVFVRTTITAGRSSTLGPGRWSLLVILCATSNLVGCCASEPFGKTRGVNATTSTLTLSGTRLRLSPCSLQTTFGKRRGSTPARRESLISDPSLSFAAADRFTQFAGGHALHAARATAQCAASAAANARLLRRCCAPDTAT